MLREVECLSGGYTASDSLSPFPCPCCKDHLDVSEAPRREEVGMQVGSTEGLPRGSPCLWAPHRSGNMETPVNHLAPHLYFLMNLHLGQLLPGSHSVPQLHGRDSDW